MKNAGVPTSRSREPRVLGVSLAAMLLALFASTLARAQSPADTTASETWKTAAASAKASSSTSAAPSNLVDTPAKLEPTTPDTAELPSQGFVDPSQPLATGTAPDSQQPTEDNGEVARYQEEQSGMPPQQLMQSRFDNDGVLSTPFGMELCEAKRTLKSGEDADGLLITSVEKGGPAATAGLHPYTHGVHDALAGAAIVAAMTGVGMPAILLLPALDYLQVGESYDMIIGVDGSRVTNFLDFQDRMRDLQPGEIVYLSVVRDGKRVQVTLPVTADTLQATN
jgi:PDZ domain